MAKVKKTTKSSGRPAPMARKAGVTKSSKRIYKCGGKLK